MADVSEGRRRYYLRDDLRALLRSKVDKASGGEGYDAVGQRIGISGPALHDFLSGKTATSLADVPALCKMFGIDPLEYLPLDDQQVEWLRLLEEVKSAGKDPTEITQLLRALVLPKTAANPPAPASDSPDQTARARPGRVKSRGTGE